MNGGSATAIIRPYWNDMVLFKRLLDIGVQTLLVPYVQTEEEARNAVAYTRYPNRGVRGYAGAPRASGYGRIKDYAHRCEDEICVLVQVETVEGLKNIEAIASVEGIDGVFIGPGDLSAALGHLGNPKHPEVLAAIEDAIRRIQACGKAAGILTGDETLAKRYVELGCLFVAVGADQNVLRDGALLAERYKDRQPEHWGEFLPSVISKLPPQEAADEEPTLTVALTLDACDGCTDDGAAGGGVGVAPIVFFNVHRQAMSA